MVEEKLSKTLSEGLASRWESMVKFASKRLYDKRKQMLAAIGSRPYKGLPVKEEQILSRFAQIQHDPQALAEVLKQNAMFKEDGRVLIPKDLVTKMKEMTQKLRKGGIE